MDIEVLTRSKDIQVLEAAWARLLPLGATVFEGFAWHRAYLDHLIDFLPFIVVVRINGYPVAIAPLQRKGTQAFSLCLHKTDRTRFWLSKRLTSDTLLKILKHLGIKTVSFTNITEEQLAMLPKSSISLVRRVACPIVCLDNQINQQLSPSLRKKVKVVERQLRQFGRLDLVFEPVARLSTIDTFLELNRDWWVQRAYDGLASKPAERAFYTDILPVLGATGKAWFSILTVNGNIASILLCLVVRDQTLAYYAGGHQPDLKPLSVGIFHLYWLLKHAQKVGYTAFDFLRGEEPYKYRFGAIAGEPAFTATVKC